MEADRGKTAFRVISKISPDRDLSESAARTGDFNAGDDVSGQVEPIDQRLRQIARLEFQTFCELQRYVGSEIAV